MKPEFIYLQIGALLELAGILTVLTNEESIFPYADIGFEVPVILLSADVQGIGLFVVGSAVTLYAVKLMQ